jgi:hypothetical protein
MARGNSSPRPVFLPPIVLEWTEDKLKSLGQDELHNLLANLAHQRDIGRLRPEHALELQERIAPLLTGRRGSDVRKKMAAAKAASAAATPPA